MLLSRHSLPSLSYRAPDPELVDPQGHASRLLMGEIVQGCDTAADGSGLKVGAVSGQRGDLNRAAADCLACGISASFGSAHSARRAWARERILDRQSYPQLDTIYCEKHQPAFDPTSRRRYDRRPSNPDAAVCFADPGSPRGVQ